MANRPKEISETMEEAGCSDDCIRRFFECKDKGEMRKADRVLEEQRKELLKELHESQRKIDCLDYLRWEMEKKKSL